MNREDERTNTGAFVHSGLLDHRDADINQSIADLTARVKTLEDKAAAAAPAPAAPKN